MTDLTVNGRAVTIAAPGYRTLLDALRDDLSLSGTKRGCDVGECGACNVLIDGRLVRACLTLVANAGGADVCTIEGLSSGQAPGAIQQAFIDAGAIQCGFCIPGMIIAATALLADNPGPTIDEIRAGLAGTLCRCSGYVKLIEAVALAGERGADVTVGRVHEEPDRVLPERALRRPPVLVHELPAFELPGAGERGFKCGHGRVSAVAAMPPV